MHASGLGLAETAKRFVGVMSLTWAGSQVTKVPYPNQCRMTSCNTLHLHCSLLSQSCCDQDPSWLLSGSILCLTIQILFGQNVVPVVFGSLASVFAGSNFGAAVVCAPLPISVRAVTPLVPFSAAPGIRTYTSHHGQVTADRCNRHNNMQQVVRDILCKFARNVHTCRWQG